MFAALLAALVLALAPAAVHAPKPSAPSAESLIAEARQAQAKPESAWEQVMPIWDRAVAAAPAGSRALGEALGGRGRAYLDQGDAPRAEAELSRAVEVLTKAAPGSDALAQALFDRGDTRTRIGKMPDAEADYRQCLAILNGLKPPPEKLIAKVRFELGYLLSLRGEREPAIAEMRAAYAARLKLLQPGDPELIINEMALGNTLSLVQQYPEAERLIRSAVARANTYIPGDSDTTCLALETLVTYLIERGRAAEAMPIAKRSVEARRRMGGSPEGLAFSLGTYGRALNYSRAYADAEAAFEEAIPIFRKTFGPGSYPEILTLMNLGSAEGAQGKLQESYDHRREGIAFLQKLLPNDAYLAGTSRVGLSEIEVSLGKTEDAVKSATRAVELLSSVRPQTDISLIDAHITLARAYASVGRIEEARAELGPNLALMEAQAKIRASTDGPGAIAQVGWSYERALDTAWLTRDMETGFRLAQLMVETDASTAVTALNARLESGRDTVAELIRRRRTLLVRRATAESAYLAAVGRDGERAAQAEAEIKAADAELAAAEAELDRVFPAYRGLVRPEPLTLAEARRRLAPGEALVIPVIAEGRMFTFALTREGASWTRTDMPTQRGAALIARLRGGLGGAGASRAAVDASGMESTSPRTFDRKAAYELYRIIFPPEIETRLKGTDTWIIASGETVNTIPFAVLVTRAPQGEDGDAEALRRTPWLIRRAAIQAAPSVAALKAEVDRGREGAFFGVGAPRFDGAAGGDRSVDAPDLASLKALPSLPGADRELTAMARALGVRDPRLLTGAEATETAVKRAPLHDARVLAFATHGLGPGSMVGVSEPALVLTPPAEPSAFDDGLLLASEAAQLDLDADWVILSACDTAAGATPDAAGYTGLARGFILAGARTVVASHWPVRDDVAARLTVETVRLAARDGRVAPALRRAMLALMDDRGVPGSADPAVWGPFVVIGR